MKIKLKICGMRDPENIQDVSELSPDYMGFIFYKNSPRCIPDNFKMPPFSSSIRGVGVFVNASEERILDAIKVYHLDLIQLHGYETVKECERIRDSGVKIIKAFSIHDQFDFASTEFYQDVVDYFLFDSKGKYYGGNGQSFDWSLLYKYNQRIPFFLSGGISSENISGINVLKGLNLYALDVNSGVEVRPGVKDIEKVKYLQSILNQ